MPKGHLKIFAAWSNRYCIKYWEVIYFPLFNQLTSIHKALFFYQGIHYLHTNWVLHRDLVRVRYSSCMLCLLFWFFFCCGTIVAETGKHISHGRWMWTWACENCRHGIRAFIQFPVETSCRFGSGCGDILVSGTGTAARRTTLYKGHRYLNSHAFWIELL